MNMVGVIKMSTDPQKKKKVIGAVIYAALYIVFAAALSLLLLTEAHMDIYVIVLTAAVAALLYKPIDHLPMYKPMILNFCLGAFVFIALYLATGPLKLMSGLLSGDINTRPIALTMILVYTGIIFGANHLLYAISKKPQKNEPHGIFMTLLLLIMNFIIFNAGISAAVSVYFMIYSPNITEYLPLP